MKGNALQLIVDAKNMICELKLSMMAHPDHTEGSEFDDYTSLAQEMEDSLAAFIKTETFIDDNTNT